MKHSILCSTLGLCLALTSAATPATGPSPTLGPRHEPRGSSRLVDFSLPSARDNSLIRLSDYSGQVVLIHWWRSTCGYCRREAPELVKLYERYKDRGFVILGVSTDTKEGVDSVPRFLEENGITWPVGLNDQGEFVREIVPLGSGATPDNYLVSRSGEITFLGLVRDPARQRRQLEQAILEALDDPVPEDPAITPRELERAPEFALSDMQGRQVTFTDLAAGRPCVVNFFFRKTGFWAGEALANLHESYARRGLRVVGINLNDQDAEIRKYIDRYDVAYPILRGTSEAQMSWIGSRAGWATFFVTADGRVLKRITDSIENGIEEQVFRKLAEHLLAEAQGA